ncbi:MAG: AAA family ATPase, partial [Solirubrobacteraceae bacterium]
MPEGLMESLFEEPGRERRHREPLAVRMRPQTLDELVGQRALLAPGTPLRRAIESGAPHSMILHGPPGSGKTTLARIVAESAGAAFEEHSAVEAGLAEVRAVIERALARGELGEVTLDADAAELIATRAGGDARVALGSLELAADGVQRI